MSEAAELDCECFHTTDGEIAIFNLSSARRRTWNRFFADPLREGVAETVVEQEQLTAQFPGDVQALDRLEALVSQLLEVDATSARIALIQAQVASTTHRFADARHFLARADLAGAPPSEINHLLLNIDQACGVNLGEALDQRRETARKSGLTQDLIALGALLADLRQFTEADQTYRHALQRYRDVSPFPVAQVCFQLGMLWGELVPEPQVTRASQWYQTAIVRLPGYTKARVHLAEMYSSCGRIDDAQKILVPAIASGDPEVHWRLADAMSAQGKSADAEAHMQAARSGFESILERHLLAFADHGAEFYAGSGNDCHKALELARVNLANRPILPAFEQAHAIAVSAGEVGAASELLAEALKRWGGSTAFQTSPLAKRRSDQLEGTAA
jgi:tetratricopeptide (TPR) repeat protein